MAYEPLSPEEIDFKAKYFHFYCNPRCGLHSERCQVAPDRVQK